MTDDPDSTKTDGDEEENSTLDKLVDVVLDVLGML